VPRENETPDLISAASAIPVTAFGGGLPVFSDGAVVGAIAVSGLSTEDDIHFANLGVDALHKARS
jgi:uncharacterized protein GlcG (DUF336 family)